MDGKNRYATLEIQEISQSLIKELSALLGQTITVDDLSKGVFVRSPIRIVAEDGRASVEWTMRKEVEPKRLAEFLRKVTR